ncbi:MAG: hypothetical protein RBU45_09495 [Myxococcota bacterium]|nr:hypothetical protein [Myxococcota bacterium]
MKTTPKKKTAPAPLVTREGLDDEPGGEEPGDPLVPYPLRLPRSLVERIRALAADLSTDPELAALARGRVTSGAVARLALLRGLDSLERDRPGRKGAPCAP